MAQLAALIPAAISAAGAGAGAVGGAAAAGAGAAAAGTAAAASWIPAAIGAAGAIGSAALSAAMQPGSPKMGAARTAPTMDDQQIQDARRRRVAIAQQQSGVRAATLSRPGARETLG